MLRTYCSQECREEGRKFNKVISKPEKYDIKKILERNDRPLDMHEAMFQSNYIAISSKIQQAVEEYENLSELRDKAMFEQVPTKHGFINGKRLNTLSLTPISIQQIAEKYNLPVQTLKTAIREYQR